MTLPLQISGKCGDIIVVIGGQTPAELQDNVLAVLGPDAMDTVADAFRSALVAGTEAAIHTKAADAVMAAGMSSGVTTQQAVTNSVTTPSVPASQAPDSVRSETDKFGRAFTYQVPGAPSCAHGPTVKMDATSKAGKAYTKWMCPTQTPFAFRQKISKAECDGGGFAK